MRGHGPSPSEGVPVLDLSGVLSGSSVGRLRLGAGSDELARLVGAAVLLVEIADG